MRATFGPSPFRRPKVSLAMAVCLAAVCQLGGGRGRAPPLVPLLVGLDRPGDASWVGGTPSAPVVTISTITGIGSGRIVRNVPRWPGAVVLCLLYADGRPFSRLESLRIEAGPCRWDTFLGHEDTVACAPASPDAPRGAALHLPVRDEGDHVRVDIPIGRFPAEWDTIRLSWIDVYRD